MVLLLPILDLHAQDALINNIYGRARQSLNGTWQYIIDPYETGYYNYRWQERDEKDREAYWNSDVPENKTDRKEHGYNDQYTLNVPGDWNSQKPELLYYEGTVWYKRSFDTPMVGRNEKVFLHFGAVNYRADVYLNGKKLGAHKGGFTPFNFQIPKGMLREKENFLVIKVDNKRFKDEIPTINTDWWNYGGITRDVHLVRVPSTFIQDYVVSLKHDSNVKQHTAEGWIVMSGARTGEGVVEIPELKIKQPLKIQGDTIRFEVKLPGVKLWSPTTPKRYDVVITVGEDVVKEKIGFRKIQVVGKQVLLNDKPLFMRGICIHEEIPEQVRRANGVSDAVQLLNKAKALHANMVRLAHYPHNEKMVQVADSMGILVWSEIPVYWTIDFTSAAVLDKAKQQLQDMITRDKNRASVIIWSVGNETPVTPERTRFMSTLVKFAKAMDYSRLVSAALEVHNVNGIQMIDDPLGEFTDIVSVNEYLGWYGGLPSDCRTAQWQVKYDKPLFISETGAEALAGFHGDSLTRWSEEYQAWYYREQVNMMKRMPDNFVGLSPWILNDFRSPRRNNPVYQEGWNNKGLYDHEGKRKQAFYVLKDYYDFVEKNWQTKPLVKRKKN
ncbi:beta-glucuronidase [Pseudochryseolinea flava]|uniref:Beta-glucuronidase n=2 Tax=Pseudochryseolinea flava TaxID=2059302 RepID=A0A364XWC2_9BACT|nr:beta-glucuronidase [Pseudochryseolinea flava]